MKWNTVQMKAPFVFVGIVVVAATVALSAASAKTHGPAGPAPDAVLTWNTNAVGAVRASSPSKFQTDGMVYMAYVQAAVYDAVTKIEGRYEPYHDFSVVVDPGASVQAAVAAAARTTLDYYLPDQQAAVDAEYNVYLGTLTGNVAGGVAVGEAAAQDIIAFRTGDGLKAATPSYGGNGPILPGQWQLQPGQSVQTPWIATMRPFLLEQRLAVPGRAAARARQPPVREGPERDGGLRCAQQHRPHRRAEGDRVLLGRQQHQQLQPDDAGRRRATRHGPRRRGASVRDGDDRHRRRGDRLLRLEVLLPILAADLGDPQRRQGRQSRHDGRPDLAGAAAGAGPSRVSVPARLLHRRRSPTRSRGRCTPSTWT